MTPGDRPAAPADGRRVTLVLPLRVDPLRRVSDLDRFLALGLPSLERFLDPRAVHELLVVAPEEDLRAVRRSLRRTPLPLRVLGDDDVCPLVAGVRGWHKQQIVKLAAAERVATAWYLTLDADVVCTRPVGLEFLFPGGRAIRQREPVGRHPAWWAGSRAVLGPGTTLAPEDVAFGVTPALLHAPSVADLVARIGRNDPARPWAVSLDERRDLDWTEYSLYWTHLVDTGRAAALYAESPNSPYCDASVWEPGQAEALGPAELDRIFDPGARHAFFVFQSRIDLDLERVAALLRPRLGLPAALPTSARGRVRLRAGVAKLRDVQRRAAAALGGRRRR